MGVSPCEFESRPGHERNGGCELDMVEMLMTVESKYGFEVDDSDVSDLATIGDVVKYIESRI